MDGEIAPGRKSQIRDQKTASPNWRVNMPEGARFTRSQNNQVPALGVEAEVVALHLPPVS
jgi:hypothetical protein